MHPHQKPPAALLCAASLMLMVGCSGEAKQEPVQEADLRSMASLAEQTLPQGSEILAACGPSEGKAYYLAPTHDGWTDDGISDGRFVFWIDETGRPGILFQDATGQFINAREDGAEIIFSFRDDAKQVFGMVEHYPSTGVAETYVVSRTPEGARKALWSSVKANVGGIGVTKTGAYVSDCI